MHRILRLFATLMLLVGAALPAQAAVTITFWSHDSKDSFPHTFFTLRGVPDAGGAPVDANYGFTAKSISPALLWGTVPGRIDIADPTYMSNSDAEFSLVLTDAQYAAVTALVREWDDKLGDGHYNLNRRNCIHFVQEAARRVGLVALDHPKLMKKPHSFLLAVEAANASHVTAINRHGQEYLPTLTPIAGAAVAAPAVPVAPSATVPAGSPALSGVN